jgi:2-phospho-L-lactate guanylyltransferase (CobY/MobA/RfbA family)
MPYESRHSQLEPDEDSLAFVANTALEPTMEGVRVAFEITRFDNGSVYLAAPKIIVEQGKRLLIPDTALMCADVDEAKDLVDAILDRLGGPGAT